MSRRNASDDVRRAVGLGVEMMTATRDSNAAHAHRTGQPSKVTEADYVRGENDCAAIVLKHWGYGPCIAKRMVAEYRGAAGRPVEHLTTEEESL